MGPEPGFYPGQMDTRFSVPATVPHFDRVAKLLSIFWCPPKRTLTPKGSPHTRLRAACCHNELTFLPELSKACHH